MTESSRGDISGCEIKSLELPATAKLIQQHKMVAVMLVLMLFDGSTSKFHHLLSSYKTVLDRMNVNELRTNLRHFPQVLSDALRTPL